MRYELDDGSVVDTDLAQAQYEESNWWDGHNHISRATGSQWEHETLYLSSKGRWWIECESQYQGVKPYAKTVNEEEAAKWILLNEDVLPTELLGAADSVIE